MARNRNDVDAAKTASAHGDALRRLEEQIDSLIDTKGEGTVNAVSGLISHADIENLARSYQGYRLELNTSVRTPYLRVSRA